MKIALKLLVAIWITSCNAQIQKTKTMIKKLADTEIKELGNQIKIDDTIFMKDGKLDIGKLENIASIGGSSLPPYYQYEEHLDNGIYISISGDIKNGFGKSIKYKNDLFKYGFNYFPTGELRKYGVEYPDFFKKGIWYDYNEDGTIEKYIDHDKFYVFNWKDVQLFLKEQKIEEKDIKNIYRGELDGVHAWEIIYIPKEFKNTDKAKVLTLDNDTGEILNTEIRDISVHLD